MKIPRDQNPLFIPSSETMRIPEIFIWEFPGVAPFASHNKNMPVLSQF